MSSQKQDLEAMMAELVASMADTPPEMRGILEQQIASCRSTIALLDSAEPAMAERRAERTPLRDEVRVFFTPEPPVDVGAWLPDDLQQSQVTITMLRCPQDARVYTMDDTMQCAIPAGMGSIPVCHGLSISFYHHGGLKSQRFYDKGLLRWSIEWHPSGQRESVAFYSDDEPRQYREHGLFTRFAPNGTIIAQTHHSHGIRHGWCKLWEEDGYPICATLYKNGQACEEYLPTGEHRLEIVVDPIAGNG